VRLPLPPLPPDWTPTGEPVWQPCGRSLVDVLTDEHAQLESVASRLATADDGQCDAFVDVLLAMVIRHMSAERQYLYPTLRVVAADGAVRARREILAEQQLQRDLLAVDAPESAAALLRDHVHRHVAVGERLLAAVGAAVADADLIRLGNRAAIARGEAPTRPHPNLPTKPPWNRVADTAAGLVDKARDAISGRPTRPADLAGVSCP
jgi:hypothetical protein